jgi:WD40 repeat protein
MVSGDAGERIRPTPPPPSPLTHLSFSSDGSCIVIAGPSAAQWICCDTFQLRGLYQEKTPTRTIVSAAGDMLARNESTCAIVCYSTTNTSSFARRWKPGFLNYHWQYDEKQMQTGGDVRAVRVHRDWTAVVYDRRLCVFGPGQIGAAPGRDKNHGMMRAVDTVDNPHGICAVTSSGPTEPGGGAPFAFACPGAELGELRVERWVAGEFVPLVIRAAHASRINAVAMSPDGRLVATASVRGTIVRVFRTTDGRLIGEVGAARV